MVLASFPLWMPCFAILGTQSPHAGIDPDDAREIRDQFLDPTPRQVIKAIEASWTIATDDTRVTIGEQSTFDLDLTGATAMRTFHTDGITPDPVGVYRQPLPPSEAGRLHAIRTAPTGEFIPFGLFEADEGHGVYLGLEWSVCRIEAMVLDGSNPPTMPTKRGCGLDCIGRTISTWPIPPNGSAEPSAFADSSRSTTSTCGVPTVPGGR